MYKGFAYDFSGPGLVQNLVVHGVGHQKVGVDLWNGAVTLSLDLWQKMFKIIDEQWLKTLLL